MLRSRSFFDRLRLQVLFFTGSGSFSYKNRLKSSKKKCYCLHIFTPAPDPTKKYRPRPAPAPQHCLHVSLSANWFIARILSNCPPSFRVIPDRWIFLHFLRFVSIQAVLRSRTESDLILVILLPIIVIKTSVAKLNWSRLFLI